LKAAEVADVMDAESSLFYIYTEPVQFLQQQGGAKDSSSSNSSNSGGDSSKGKPHAPGFQVSVLTEDDHSEVTAAAAAAAAAGRKDVSLGRPLVCDVTRSSDSLSFSFVARKGDNLDNMFVGATTTSQVHQHGLQIPCFGWKQVGGSGRAEANPSFGWLNPDGANPQGSGRKGPQGADCFMPQSSAAAAAAAAAAAFASSTKSGELSGAEKWSGVFNQWSGRSAGGTSSSSSSTGSRPLPNGLRPPPRRKQNSGSSRSKSRHHHQQDEQGADLCGAVPANAHLPGPLWCPGDHVELVVDFGGIHTLSLRINGRSRDVVRGLPSSSEWCWYLALYSGLEVVCVVFEKESYSLYAGDYKTVRYLV
jgi:hypothetical protein